MARKAVKVFGVVSLIIAVFSSSVSLKGLQSNGNKGKSINKDFPSIHSAYNGQKLKDSIKKVHIIYMNHLDVGYDGVLPKIGFVNTILNLYFTSYFPRAVSLYKQLKEGGYPETFKYTTHPWLVSLYLDCPPNLVLAGIKLKCPNATEVATFEAAVKQGIITWHSGPMNMQSEFVDEQLYMYGLNMSSSLDKRFGIKRPFHVLSQRDVPGLTKAVIPSLIKAGIGGVSVGVNPMTAPPDVPTVFRWQHLQDEVIATWHKGGYPNNPGPNPAHPGGLSLRDCATVPGHPEALCFAFRTDNSGPPESVQELLGYFEILRQEFPAAELMASTLEDFMVGLQPIKSQLPVVSKEIGDTWIMGVASDPRKTAEYRAASRALGACVTSGSCSYNDVRVWNASRFLLKMGEHTWGLPSVYDTVNWTNAAFYRASSGDNYKNCTRSWIEQRVFLDLTLSALGNHSVVKDIQREVAATRPTQPDLTGYESVPLTQLCEGTTSFALSPDGALNYFKYKNVQYAGSHNRLGKFTYVSYNETDFKKFASLYDYDNVSAGFNKVNITANARPISRTWPSRLTAIYQTTDPKAPCSFWAHVELVDKLPMIHYGAPLDVWIQYTDRLESSPGVDVDLRWFDKTSTRTPEALMFSFEPLVTSNPRFHISKMGQLVDPLNGMINGSNYLHALDNEGVHISSDGRAGIQISSPDVALVSLMTKDHHPTSYSMPLTPITSTITGVSFNMYNNVWDTNYIFWYPYLMEDANHKARFSVRLG